MKRLYFFLTSLILLCAACGPVPNVQPEPKEADAMTEMYFLFVSDTQADEETGDYTELGEVMSAAVKDRQLSFILHGGDAVNDGSDEEEWADFHAVYDAACGDIRTYMARGNHDEKGEPDLPPYYEWLDKGPKDGFYSFTACLNSEGEPALHFLIMNSNLMGLEDAQLTEWVKAQLAATEKAAHHIVVFHHPFYPSPDNAKDAQRAEVQRALWEPIFTQYGVDLVLNGHQHIYTRNEPGNGITYIMAATGSKPNYDLTPPDCSVASYCGISYVLFRYDMGSKKLYGTAYDKDGASIDEFVLD